MSRLALLIPLAFLAFIPPAQAYEEGDRTANRDIGGKWEYPERFFNQQPFAEFKSGQSNHDVQNQHPDSWQGQEWDTASWNDKQWTPEIAVKKFYENRVFNKQYMRGQIPVVEVGPTFYKMSDLDQRRSIKLLSDYEGVFAGGYKMIELRDWRSRNVIGSYTRQGLTLD